MQGHQKGEIVLKVENKPIDSIKPYENNPRDNDDAINAVANSIHEFGWQQPIVVDTDGVIIVGHTRLKAAKKLKLKQVPVTVAENLTDEQVKAYRLADNKTGELADWDADLLTGELGELDNFDFDMSDFGFEELDEPDPQPKDENTDPVPIDDKTVIIIESDDEAKLEQYFDKLVGEGYPCRLSTL